MSAPRQRLRLAASLLCAATLFASLASGATDGATVALVLPDGSAPDLTEAYVRMQGELRAAGFEVRRAAAQPGSDPPSALTAVAEALHPAAVIDIVDSPSGALEFWILDVQSGKTTLKRLMRTGARAPEILAISAVELLLAGLSELDIQPAAAAPTPPAVNQTPARESSVHAALSASRPSRFCLELGGAASISTGGAGVAFLPAARVEWAALPSLRARLSGFGWGTEPKVTGPGGLAQSRQGLVLTELVLRPWRRARLTPQFSLGSGAYYFRIEGHAADGSQGASASRWSAAVDGGAGLAWSLTRRFELVSEAHVLLAEPYPSIRFSGSEQATAGRPNVVVSLLLAGWL